MPKWIGKRRGLQAGWTRGRAVSLAVLVIASLLSVLMYTAIAYGPVPSGSIVPHVWDETRQDWVNGNPRGYSEGETAAMAVEIIGEAGNPYYVDTCLQAFEDPFTDAYGFVDFGAWDTTYLPQTLPRGPDVDYSTGWDRDHAFVWGYNVDILSVSAPALGGATNDCDSNYLGVRVEFQAATADDAYIVFGGLLARPGYPLLYGQPDTDGDGFVGGDQGASHMTGVFQTRLEGAGDKSINFKPSDIQELPGLNLSKTVMVAGGTCATDAVEELLVPAGTEVQYCFEIYNSGLSDLLNVTLSDPLLGLALTGEDLTGDMIDADGVPATGVLNDLEAGGTAWYTSTAEAIYEDRTNTATATGSNLTYEDPSTARVYIQAPAIDIVKALASYDDNDGSGSITVGDDLWYQFEVTNVGNVTLDPVSVTDDTFSIPVTCPDTALDPTESTLCTADEPHTVTLAEANAGSVYNEATATGTPPSGPDVTDWDDLDTPVTQAPAIDIVKTLASYDDNDGSGSITVGDDLWYQFEVTNVGNVTLDPVSVTDDTFSIPVTCPDTALDPTESTLCTADEPHTVTQAEGNAGNVYNEATATGTPPSGPDVTDSDDLDTPVTQFGLAVAKTCTEDVFWCDDIEYQVTVTNTGDVPLTGVVVEDPIIGLVETVDLAAGESKTFTGQYKTCPPPKRYYLFLPLIQRRDDSPSVLGEPPGRAPTLDAPGTITNTVTATTMFGQVPVEAADSCVTKVHGLEVSKDVQSSLERLYQWTIAKTVDDPGPTLLLAGQRTEADYGVTLDLDDPPFVDSGWTVQGTITIDNPAPMDATLASVTDMVSPYIAATVDCPSLIVPSGSSLACTYGPVQLPGPSNRTNTATATLINNNGQMTDFETTIDIDFSQASLTEIDKEVGVDDSFKGFLGTLRYGVDPLPSTFTYTRTITTTGDTCDLFVVENEACFVTNDTAATDCDEAVVEIVELCRAGFAYEDLPMGTPELDWDYNDWMATIEVEPTFSGPSAGGELLRMDFTVQPEARGASYDHAFSLNIPADEFGCDGTATLTRFDGEGNVLFSETGPFDASIDNEFQVVPRTSNAFPPLSNTDESKPYVPTQRTALLNIVFDEPCPFQPRGYDPEPTIHGEGLFFNTSLYVYGSGQTIGPGDERTLLVPVQWKWPEERIPVWEAYPLVQEGDQPIFPWAWWTEWTDAVYDGKP